MIPLCYADIGKESVIKKVGGNAETKRHLEALGFVVGSGVTVVSRIAGSIIVNVKNVRVALNQETAKKIMI